MHFPEDFNFPHRVRISNGNIMYAILRQVPVFGGGQSSLFHRCRLIGVYQAAAQTILADQLFVEDDQDAGVFKEVDINEQFVSQLTERFGEYKFKKASSTSGDWLDDL